MYRDVLAVRTSAQKGGKKDSSRIVTVSEGNEGGRGRRDIYAFSIYKFSLYWCRFNTNHLTRVYPGSSRISSSNFDPTYFWMLGCQMVALNYQTNGMPFHMVSAHHPLILLFSDLPLQHYLTIFGQNRGCGYVKKPKVGVVMHLTLHVIL